MNSRDVVVIGAGLVGSAAARFLAAAGSKVAVTGLTINDPVGCLHLAPGMNSYLVGAAAIGQQFGLLPQVVEGEKVHLQPDDRFDARTSGRSARVGGGKWAATDTWHSGRR